MDYAERTKACHTLVTEEAVLEALKADKGVETQLTSWRIEDFTKFGDNYASIVTSVVVCFALDGVEEQTSYVVKVNPCHGYPNMEAATNIGFVKEAEFYGKLLPRLNAAMAEASLETLRLPKYYHSCLEVGKELLFLEDLRRRSFKMYDRRRGLDVAHAVLVLKELAKLHAASLLLQNEDPEYFQNTLLQKDWSNAFDGVIDVDVMFGGHFDNTVAMLEKIGGYETAIKWIQSTKPNIRGILGDQLEPSKYHVLCHGDAWNNNCLFRYNEAGDPEEVMLVDLQLNHRVSFGNDLNYFLYTSLAGDVRRPNLDALLETYRGHFNTVMEAGAGGKGCLSKVEVQKEFRSKNIIGAIFGMLTVNFVLLDPASLEKYAENDTKQGEGEKDLNKDFEKLKEYFLAMIDTNPLIRPRLLAMFDEFKEFGLIPT
ncbi:hypothetical protein C7M84_008850 [Penaeus vannamei]|uniref:CHK kinase-like domain-containing protein n=1 Tax=Penaeus vannamei TaxID=6689 RepID=A0A3R7PP40_PENVA|nr:uncharacterized protein LOC113810418 [Penaeus vannamei]ROT72735.1 hypothetical protein C7M84_008850 [Penaeus vannamei]